MSDLSIPGVPGTSKYNTDEIIENLMKVERIPLGRMEADRTRFEKQKTAWQDTNRALTRLREASRSLYSFENPFNDRLATSGDESVISAIADRTAAEETVSIVVKSVAGRDRFISDSVSREFEVDEGTYRFAVGEKESSFTFRGGSLATFARTLNERTGNLVRARVVRNTSDTQVVVIEALEAGEENTLRFLEDSATFGMKTGIIKSSDDTFRVIDVMRSTVRRLENPINDDYIEFSDDGAVLKPRSAIAIPVVPSVEVKENLVVEITYSMTQIPYEYTPPTPPSGPATPTAQGIEFRGIAILNEASRVLSPEWSPPPPPEKYDDLGILSLTTEKGEVYLPNLTDVAGPQTIRISLADHAKLVSGVNFRNDNTHRTFTLDSVKIFDPSTRGEYLPKNPIETASNAVVQIDGIEVIRDSNTIDDLIAGVTFNLKSAHGEPIEVKIEPDREAVKDTIIEFVGYYNQTLTDINILTSRSEDMIDEIGYFTNEERDAAREKLGLFQGDIIMMQLKSRLQTIMMNAYPTDGGGSLALLDQIGVSTNPTRGGGTIDRSRLRGYLDIDETRLDSALELHMDEVQRLFGRDSDGDLIADFGVAVSFEGYLKPFVETGGFIPSRISTLSTRVSDKNDDIGRFEEKLESLEQKYREDYGAMEAALQNLERSSQQLDSFSTNSGN
jgi:flagellar hook-associated protein 2